MYGCSKALVMDHICRILWTLRRTTNQRRRGGLDKNKDVVLVKWEQQQQHVLVSRGGRHLVVVLEEPLVGLLGLLVLDPGLLLLLLLRLHLVGVERLLLLAQLGQGTAYRKR